MAARPARWAPAPSSNNAALVFNRSDAVTVGIVISGTGSLTQAGAGTLTLTGANTYSGATTINAGTLQVGNGGTTGALGNGAGAVTNDGSLIINRSNAITVANAIGGTGALTQAGTGTTTLTGANTYSGTTTISAGTLQVGAGGTIGTLGTGAVTDNGTLTFNRSDALTVGNDISGTGALTKLAAGATTLTGTNTYSGTTTITTGTLQVGNGGTTGTLGTGTVTNNAALAINRSDAVTVGNVIGGTGTLTQSGTGTTTLTAANTYTGATSINAGSLVASHNNALGNTSGGVTVANGATLELAGVAIGNEAVTLNGTGVGGNGALVASGAASLAGQVTLATDSSIGVAAGNSLALSGAVEGSGGLSVGGGGSVAFGGTLGGTTALASFTSDATTTLGINGGLVRTSGDQSYGGDTFFGAATTLRTTSAGDVTAAGAVTALVGTLTFDSVGGDVAFDNAANNFGTVQVTGAADVSIVDAGALAIGTSSLSGRLTAVAAGTLTVSGVITANGAGDAIALSGSRFVNAAGASALSAPNGRWLVWSSNASPFLGGTPDSRGGLAYDFKQYDATYGVTTVQGSGNGFLYQLAPVVTASLGGSAARTYDGGTVAPTGALTLGQSGAIDGDTVNLSIASAAYDTRNVGSGKTVTANVTLVGASNGLATVYGYQLAAPPTAAASVGTINQAALTINAVTNTKTYDGDASSAATPTVLGLVGGDTVTGLTQAYSDRNAGTNKTQTVTAYTVNDGFSGGNYTVATVNNTTGVINQAALTLTAQTNTKTYDGDASSAATPTVLGLVGGDTVTGLTQAYSDRNAGTNKTQTVTAYTVNDGFSGGNYTVATVNNTTGVINQAALTLTAQTNTKTYDGDASSAATPTVLGLVGGDTVTGLTQAYSDRNAGTNKTQTVTAYTVNDGFSGGNYTVATVNNTAGVINQAALTVTAQAQTRGYDGTAISSAAPVVTGTLYDALGTAATQAFDTKHAGTNKTLTASGLVVNDGNSGSNYSVSYVTALGQVDPALLTVTAQAQTRGYDGTAASSVAPVVTGTLYDAVGTAAAQSFDTKHVGTGKTLTANGLVVNDGNGGNNYSVSYVAAASGTITARPITVTAQTDTKVYDAAVSSAAAPLVTSGSVAPGDSGAFSQIYNTANAGTGKTLTASGAVSDGNGGNNYVVSFIADTSGVINPASLAITANNASRPAAQPNPPFSASYSGLQGGDSPASLAGSLLYATLADAASPAGSYAVTPSGVSSPNYTIVFIAGTLTVIGTTAAIPDPLATAHGPMQSPVTAASGAQGAGVGRGIFGAGRDDEPGAQFLNGLPPARAGQSEALLPPADACGSFAPFGVLRCGGQF